MSDNGLFLVFSNPVEGRDGEFNEWYDTVHVPEVLAIPGILSAQRFDLEEPPTAPTPPGGAVPPLPHRVRGGRRRGQDHVEPGRGGDVGEDDNERLARRGERRHLVLEAAWGQGGVLDAPATEVATARAPPSRGISVRAALWRTTPSATRASTVSWSSPNSASAVRVWSPGRAGPPGSSVTVREKRGAGAGCTTPSTSTKVRRYRFCACSGASERLSTGAAHEAGRHQLIHPLGARLLSEPGGHHFAMGCPGRGIVAGLGHVDTEAGAQFGVELRLNGTHREMLAVGGLVGPVEMGTAIDDVGLAPVPPFSLGQQAVDRRQQAGRRRRAWTRRSPDRRRCPSPRERRSRGPRPGACRLRRSRRSG